MLMLFGFLLASRVYKAILTLVDAGMVQVLDELRFADTIFSGIMIMIVYVTFVMSLTNTSFSLIYAVPDKILRWLGGPAESTGTEALSKAESGAKSGASQMGEDASKGGAAAAGKAGELAGEHSMKAGKAVGGAAASAAGKAKSAAAHKLGMGGDYGRSGGKIGPPEGPKGG